MTGILTTKGLRRMAVVGRKSLKSRSWQCLRVVRVGGSEDASDCGGDARCRLRYRGEFSPGDYFKQARTARCEAVERAGITVSQTALGCRVHLDFGRLLERAAQSDEPAILAGLKRRNYEIERARLRDRKTPITHPAQFLQMRRALQGKADIARE